MRPPAIERAGASLAGGAGDDIDLGCGDRLQAQVTNQPDASFSQALSWIVRTSLSEDDDQTLEPFSLVCRRCPKLRTLVLVLELNYEEDVEGERHIDIDAEGMLMFAGMVASLDALARGAPALAALQLVLRLRDFDASGSKMILVWHALERLGRLSALTVCMEYGMDEFGERFGELLAAQLDKVDARLPGVTDLCLATTSLGFSWQEELDGPWQHQVATCICCTPLTCGRQCSAPEFFTASSACMSVVCFSRTPSACPATSKSPCSLNVCAYFVRTSYVILLTWLCPWQTRLQPCLLAA